MIIDCAPGLSQLVWGALRTADFVLIPYIPDRTAEDNVGWLAHRVKDIGAARISTVPNRVSGQDSRAQGIIAAISAKYAAAWNPDTRPTQPLATALDSRDKPGHARLEVRRGDPTRERPRPIAVLNAVNRPVGVAAE